MTTPHEQKLTTIDDMLASLKRRKTVSDSLKATAASLQDELEEGD